MTNLQFDGTTYDAARDGARLTKQHQAVWDLMRDGKERTLYEISDLIDAPEQSVSARLRDFRKDRFGAHFVDKRYMSDGVWVYKLTPNKS